MKRNAEKILGEGGDEDSGLHVVEMPRQANGATALTSPSAHSRQPRPEIAVLGWDVRSYRLALRENKI